MASLDHSELNHRHTTLSQLRLFYIYNYVIYIQSFGTYKLVWYMLYLLLNRKQLANIFTKHDNDTYIQWQKIEINTCQSGYFTKHFILHLRDYFVAIVDFQWTTTFSTKNRHHPSEGNVNRFQQLVAMKWDASPGGRYQNYYSGILSSI